MGRVVDDVQYEKLGMSYGPNAGVIGDFTSPQLIYGDSTGMQIKVAADRYALVRGHMWWSGSSIFTKSIGSNSSGSTRIDLVVLQLDRSTWDVTCVVKAGTPGAGAPAVQQDLGTTGLFELPLATVTVANGAGTVSAANVTYVAAHVGTDGGLRVSTEASLPYIPYPYPGMTVGADTGAVWARTASSTWVNRAEMLDQLTSDASGITGTSLSTVLTVTLPAVGTYRFDAQLNITNTVSAGRPGFGIGGTSTPTSWRWAAHTTVYQQAAGSQGNMATGTTYPTTGTAVSQGDWPVSTGYSAVRVLGQVTVSAIGTLTMRLSQTVAGTTTARNGSIVTVRLIG